MSFKLYQSQRDLLVFVSSVDDAVDVSTEELREAYRTYLKTHDRKLLKLIGSSVEFHCRPLDIYTLRMAEELSERRCLAGLYTHPMTAAFILGLSCAKIIGSFLDENGEPIQVSPGDMYRFRHGRRTLSDEFALRVDEDIALEGAEFLLNSLPDYGDDPIPKEEELAKEPKAVAKPAGRTKKKRSG